MYEIIDRGHSSVGQSVETGSVLGHSDGVKKEKKTRLIKIV